MEEDLRPGFRFYPTEEELVSFYLPKKLEGTRQDLDLVTSVLDIYKFNPWDLPQYAGKLCRKDPEQWFFFIPRQEKEARGGRPNRLTTSGYWKATGSPGYVYSSDSQIIGVKRTLVFYKGRAPNGRKTTWKMNEYRAIEGEASSSISAYPKLREEFSLCRVCIKSKCLRAFDRRPSASATIGTDDEHVQYHDHDEETPSHQPTATSRDQSSMRDHANPNSQTTEETPSHQPTAISLDQSSARDHANPNSQTTEINDNWDMAVDDNYDSVWEWDMLKYLL